MSADQIFVDRMRARGFSQATIDRIIQRRRQKVARVEAGLARVTLGGLVRR